ncbi:MAG: PepSY domain-containing protein [Psychrobacter sp.]|nr:PepSY domain-containing protein [Psychrobacter sp.]
MSLPLLRPLLLTVGATSLVFFGGVIALTVQSSEPINSLVVPTLSTPSLVDQNTNVPSIAALTSAQAIALAKQDMPSAQLQATPELINYNGTVAYEVLLDSGTAYIDANLGTVLNPVATNNYRADGFDDDYDDDYEDDDDHYRSEKHGNKKHDDDYYKNNERLIATSYEQYDDDKEGYDD